jgi:hypothetical protein
LIASAAAYSRSASLRRSWRLERLGQQLMAARRHRRLLREPLELLGGELSDTCPR